MEIRKIFDVLFKRRVLGSFLFLTFFLFIALLTFIAPKNYEAISRITLEEGKTFEAVLNGIGLTDTNLGVTVDQDNTFDTYIEMAKGTPLLKKFIDQLNITNNRGELLTPEKLTSDGILSKFRKRPSINIEEISDTSIITFTAVSTDPEQAVLMADNIAEMYSNYLITLVQNDFVKVKIHTSEALLIAKNNYFSSLKKYHTFQKRYFTKNDDPRKYSINATKLI